MSVPGSPRLLTYMITGEGDTEALVARVGRALNEGVDLLQLRRKEAPGRSLEELAVRLLEAFPEARGKMLVNDRLDVALAVGASGVHLPSDGLPVAEVRRHAPPHLRVALSTHSLEEAERGAREGADLVVFGPIFPTPSKPGHPGLGLEALRNVVRAVPIPVFALGGITPSRLAQIAACGAHGVAGISMFEDERALNELRAFTAGGGSGR